MGGHQRWLRSSVSEPVRRARGSHSEHRLLAAQLGSRSLSARPSAAGAEGEAWVAAAVLGADSHKFPTRHCPCLRRRPCGDSRVPKLSHQTAST